MIFKDLFNDVNKSEVLKSMLEIYPNQENNLVAYDKMLDKLIVMEADKNPDMVLVVLPEEDYFCGEMVDDVVGFSIKNQQTYAIEFTPWKEWLGMTVCEKSLEYYGDIPFIVHCLYEMSFVSFEEDDIKNEIDILKEREEEIENGTATFISMDEICERFGINPLPEKTEEEIAARQAEIQENFDRNQKIKEQFLSDFIKK